MSLTYGVAVLARPTFDVPFAAESMQRAFAALESAGIRTRGPRELLFDREAAEKAIAAIREGGPIDLLLILQVTFTDATMTVKLAREATTPIAIWALPEPRIGGRLRLNAYCGLNLAAHALGRAGVAHGWLYASPDAPGIGESLRALARESTRVRPRVERHDSGEVSQEASRAAERVLERLRRTRITVVGRHPDGFDTCEYDPELLERLAGVKVSTVQLGEVFDGARSAAAERVAAVKATVARKLEKLGEVDAAQLDRSLRVFCALDDLRGSSGTNAFAVRCWPEMFTEYGCAACGPMAMLNEAQIPAACEADVHGSLSQLMLQELAGEPAWMADLVDITPADDTALADTAVLWHCGLAPLSMCDPGAAPEATIHTNRRMPLLHQFTLKPGRITLARLSRARNETKLMIAGAEAIRAPMPFTGCSGTIRFDRPAEEVSRTIIDQGLEHHFALSYGDHKPALRAIAARWNVPVLDLA